MIDGTRRRLALPLAALLTASALAPLPAHAGAPDTEAKSRQLFKQAESLANDGKWKEACVLYQAAHDLNSTGGTALRSADCYEKIGEYERALGMYEYVVDHGATDKLPERVALAEGRVAALKKQLAKDMPPPTPTGQTPGPVGQVPPGGAPTQPPVVPLRPNRVPAFVSFGVGGVGLVLGAVFGGLALSQASSVKSGCVTSPCQPADPKDLGSLKSQYDASKTKAVISDVGLGIAVVGVATGAVLWALGVPKAAKAVHGAVGPGGVTVRF